MTRQTTARGIARVLAVDDDQDVRRLLQDALTMEGYDVALAADGAEAVAAIRTQPPDVIVLDLMMPSIDGLRLLDVYRQLAVRPAPIIVLTAAPAHVQRLAEATADVVVRKPFSLDRLFELIAHYTGRQAA